MPTTPEEKVFQDVQLHVDFTQASTRSNISTYDPTAAEPENISTAFGKLSKWYEALVPTGGSDGQFLGWNSDGTAKWVNNPNADTKVTQQSTSSQKYRAILFGYTEATDPSGLTSTVTNKAFVTSKFYVKPSTGQMFIDGSLQISNSSYGPLTIKRTTTAHAGIRFENSNGFLGSLGIGTVDGVFKRYLSDNSTYYTILDTGNTSVTTTGSGNAITSLSFSNGVFTADKGSTFLTQHPTITLSADTTSTPPQLSHGGTFTAITSVTREENGHVTKINTATYTLPSDQNTDTLMTQTNTTGSADYRVLLSGNANDTTETTTGRKSTNLKFNPSTGVLSASSGVTTKTITRSALKGMLTGSGTAAQDKGSGVSPRYFPAKWTFNTGLTAANGDVFIIKLPTAGHSNGVFLSIDNGANYYPISVNGTSRLTTHYGNGYSIAVMFKSDGSTADVFPLAGGDSRSTVTGGCWQVLNYYDSGNSNTYDRNRYNANIKAGSSALVGGNIIVGKDGVFNHLKSGGAFDISYPILYLNAAVAANATTTDTYDILHITITTTQSITLTAYKPVFIKGTLSGTIFTPVSATPLTQTVPTTDDGYVYIYLGNATSTTSFYMQERHPIYEYKNGVFGEITNYSANAGSVAWSGVSGKPTTISGYGIADAKIENGTITLGSNTITPLTSHQTITTGSTNGTISVAGTDVAVKGLGSAAYTESSAYLASTTKYAGSSSAGGAATKSYKLIQNGTTRPTTANIACVGDQSVSLMQVSSSMTIGQPAGEGYILNFDWDTTSSWQSQLFIPIKYLTPPAYRAQNNNSAWADTNQWVNILTDKFGAGKDGYISFPGDGSYTASQENVTGGLVITLPFGMTSIMMTFVIDIFDYRDGYTVSYRVAGFNYDSNSKWYYCTAICIGKYGSLSSNLTVRFGHNGTKAQIQIGETTTAWKWPQVRIRDILLGHNATQGNKTYLSNKTGWTISFVTTNISNISQTITNTHIGYNCVGKATLTGDESSDFASYPWHKFASITCDAGNGDYNLTLLVSKTWGSYGTNTGILTVHIRTTDTKIYGTSHFGWLLKGTDITADNFKLLYTDTANTKTEIELWYKQESRYDGWIFTVLSESNRATFTNKWVTYKNWGHGSASLPTATGTVPSSILNISNNAATATTATKAYNVAKNPSTTTTYAISFGGAGESGVEEPTNGTFTTGAKDHYVNDGLGYRTREGVANGTEGLSALVLGNSLASSVANNKTGYVRQYSVNKYYTDLKPNTLTASRTILLPDAAGTIAVFPAARTSGQVVVTDGTAGAVKSSGYTIATSVPSGAKFTDEKVTQTAVGSTYTNYRPIVISGANSATEGFSPSTTTDGTFITSSLYCQPSTGMLHANIFKAGKASTTDGEIKFYRSGSGNSGETTLKATAQSTSGTYLLPARGNLQYTLSCGHEDLSAPTGSLSAANVLIPSYTKFIKIVFKSDSSATLYSMVEIPYFGNGDYSALVQVGTFGDNQGSLRIIMKAVIIQITDGTQTGRKSFTITGSPTTKINGSSVSDYTRNITIHKIYAVD